ncbi:MAG TPA: hypothetical protein VHD81_00085 [Mycobacteriales bacterium]|nr:hypothetical protein [Mycobacteriales bacterium]
MPHAKHGARHHSPQCPAAYPLSKVRAGLRGTGWTTVKGVHPRPFAVRVLGRLHDGIAPGIDMIVIKTQSRTIKSHGTWEGMSGSPIYASDGRLIGALSYGLSFGATNKAGVTPAAAMYQLLSDRNRSSSKAYAKRVMVPRSMDAPASRSGSSSSRSGELQLLPTPITVTGLPSSHWSDLRERLRSAGATPFSLHSGSAKGVSRHGSAKNIKPGAPFGVTIAYGDYTVGGVGTVTAVCGHKVLAFGHPMNLTGATTETANAAQVLYVQRDPTGPSFVMANIGHSVGTLDQDRLPGIRATIGPRPPATRITTHVIAPGTGLHRTGVSHTSLVDEVADAAGGSTYYNLLTTTQHEGEGSSSYSWSARGRLDDGKRWKFHRTDLYTDPFDVEFGTSWQIFTALATIVGNPFDGLSVSQVKVHATATETVREWDLRDLDVQQDGTWQSVTPATTIDVSPGDTLQLRATLQAYRNSHQTKKVDVAVHIPAAAGAGTGSIQVAGGGDLEQLGADTSTVTSFADLLKVLKATPHGNDLVAQLVVPDPTGVTTITKNHHDRLTRVTRGTLTLQLNVLGPVCSDCDGGDGGDGGDGPPIAD